MYPPAVFPTPVPSFPFPVDPPGTDPFDDPLFQVCLNRDWLPFVAGACKQLLLESTWNFTTTADLLAIQGKVFDLISAFGQVDAGCGIVVPTTLCLSGTFADADYGYEPDPLSLCTSVWVATNGWQSCDAGGGKSYISIFRNFAASTLITDASFTLVIAPGATDVTITVTWSDGGSPVLIDTTTYFLPGTYTFSLSAPTNADSVNVTVVDNLSTGMLLELTDWKLCYNGVFPLAGEPTTFTHVFDFSATDGGFTTESNPTYANTGVYTPPWETQANVNPFGNDDEVMIIHRTFTNRVIKRVTINWTAGQVANGGFRGVRGKLAGSTVWTLLLDSGSGTFTEFATPNLVTDEIQIVPTTSGTTVTTPVNSVASLTVFGEGTDPF